MPSSRESSRPRDWTCVSASSALQAAFYHWITGEATEVQQGVGIYIKKVWWGEGHLKVKIQQVGGQYLPENSSRSWKPEHCPWHSRLMLPAGGTVHYAVHWQRNSPTISTLWGFPLSFERETQTLATTIEPDGVFSSHEFLPVSKPFQVISKQLKSKFR